MKKILIWDPTGSGHHTEYITLLYLMASKDKKNQYVFSIKKEVIEKGGFLIVEDTNIKLDIIPDNVSSPQHRITSLIQSVKKHSPDRLFLIRIEEILSIRALLSLCMQNIEIQGIMYRIYLYEWKNERLKRKLKDFLYSLAYKMPMVKKVFVLNDMASAHRLNQVWYTNKYQYLTDPVTMEAIPNPQNIRVELNINDDTIIFLHCGSMSKRKGTIEILKALIKTDEDKNKRFYCFVGKVNDEIISEFNKYIDLCREKHNIYVENDFVSYKRLCGFINSSNYILLPYKNTSQSSGVIAYASLYNKCVAVSKDGLLGRLVKRFNLGNLIEPTEDSIAAFIQNDHNDTNIDGTKYLKSHNHNEFIQIISNALTV